MSNKRSVSINNKNYSTVNGEAIKTSQRSNKDGSIKPVAGTVHRSPQKSRTLNRQFIQKPQKNSTNKIVTNQAAKRNHQRTVRSTDITKSGAVSRFNNKTIINKGAPTISPAAIKSTVTSSAKPDSANPKAASTKKTKSAKEQAIDKAMKTASITEKKKRSKKTLSSKKKRRIIVSVSVLAGFIITAFLVLFFSVPSLSIHLASNQAGIDASYPSKLPEGVNMKGAASFKSGAVAIPLSSADGASFDLLQSKTTSDSEALKQEVKRRSNNNFTTTEYKGLTILNYADLGQTNKYTTVWINGNVLYTISGEADLSAADVRTIIDGLS